MQDLILWSVDVLTWQSGSWLHRNVADGQYDDGMTPVFRSSVDGSPDRQRSWRKDEHHDDSSKEVP